MVVSSEERTVLEQVAKFNGLKELLEDDMEETDPDESIFTNVAENHPPFKQLYLDLVVAYTKYKSRFVPGTVSEVEFNLADSSYTYKDSWMSDMKKEFRRINKSAVDFLRKGSEIVSNDTEEKVNLAAVEECDKVITKVNLESGQVTLSLDETYKNLQSVSEINLSQAQVYNNLTERLMFVIDNKIPDLLKSVSGAKDATTKNKVIKCGADFEAFEAKEKPRLYQLVQLIAQKTVHLQAVSSSSDRPSSVRHDTVHLKKMDPPRFSGQEVDFPEFHRKWLAVVGPARLPEEAEIDRLRDSVPKDAMDMLTGVTKITKAWELLTKRFGDRDLIATKLKNELKSLSISVKHDHEKIIALVIKVRSLVSRLETMKASEALRYDGEFVSAVYFQLPERHKVKWLEFDSDKYDDKWTALLVFLDDAYEKAVKEKLLLASFTPPKDKKVNPGAGVLATNVRDDTDESDPQRLENQKNRMEEARERIGKCPVCRKEHTYESRWSPTGTWPSDRLIMCQKFSDMNSKQRAEAIEKTSGCPRCTGWKHKKADCKMPVRDCRETVNGSRCHKDHSKLVCNSGVAYCLAAKSISAKSATIKSAASKSSVDIDVFQPTLHYLQDIIVNREESARTLWDDGSNRVLVNNDFARENNLKSKDASVTMKVVGAEKTSKVKIYELDLQDMYGKQYSIWGYGIDHIIDADEPLDLAPIRHLFPHVPDAAFSPMPKKRIDLLIGLNYNALHPSGGLGVDGVDNLKALRSRFGCGWVIGGCHKKLLSSPLKFTPQAAAARLAKVTLVPDIVIHEFEDPDNVNLPKFAKVNIEPALTPDFWESDNLGVLPPRKCDRCRQCAVKGECSETHFLHTLKEENELHLIRDNIKIVDGEVQVTYPFIKDPCCLQNNRSTVVKVATRLWHSLKKDGLLNEYQEEMKKYIDRGTFVKLSQEELNMYEGPHQYITHHGVLRDSLTTHLRVVTNSSFDNNGHSLNSCLPKGPNSLNDMYEITIRFRGYEVAFVFDLSKAYNTMRTSVVEKHLRRFVWRFDEDQEWEDYGIDRVHFGDRPAATQLEVSKNMIADLGLDIDEEACKKIKEDMYVDDGVTGGKKLDVERMVGNRDEDGNFDGTLPTILRKGNYFVKDISVGGKQDQADENLLGNKVFGYIWNHKEDVMGIQFSINMSRKRRGVRVKPDLTLADLDSLRSITMTKRLLLGVTNSFGDFLGIASPYTIKLKLSMKKMFELDIPLGWDEDIPSDMRDSWIAHIVEALVTCYLYFPRSTRPDNAVGGPLVVGFGDGAFAAYAASVYLVWMIGCSHGQSCQGHYSSTLMCAKSRVTPLRGFTIPRSELSGGVLVSRLVLAVVHALSKMEEKPVGSIILLDSTCTISSLEENAKKLKPFFHNRRAEILDNIDAVRKMCPMEDVHHVSGSLNPADIATRGNSKLEDIGPESYWQSGPQFLCSPRELWPVTREFVRVPVPDEERRLPAQLLTAAFRGVVLDKSRTKFSTITSVLPVTHQVIGTVLDQNNSIESRKRVIALVIRGWNHGKTVQVLSSQPTADELVRSERMILAHAMLDTADAFLRGELTSLLPEREGPLIVTRGRLGEKSLERLLGVSALPILMPSSRVAELYMWRAHLGYSGLFHRSVAQTLSKSRDSVWIVKGKNLAKKICWECMECAKERKKLATQQMALFRKESLEVCPPWTNIALDFAGPVVVKGDVNLRSRRKCWILVYICRNTKAICLLPTSGYSTADFLCKHEEFVARKNRPKTIVSDRGSQLVRAGMTLAEKEMPVNWKWEDIVRNNSASSWEFVPVGCQHRNGLPESTVKILKKCLNLALAPGTVLKYSELVTVLAKISHCVNSRPIGLGSTPQDSQQEDFMSPITPNQLLLGKTGDEAPPLEYEDDDRLTARLAYVSGVYNTWWKSWYQQVLPTLVPCRKWKKEVRNLEVGDLVFMFYPSSIKDHYRLARVVETKPDEKGLVRSVKVCYRKKDKRESLKEYKAKPLTQEWVAVQRLSVFIPASEQVNSPTPDFTQSQAVLLDADQVSGQAGHVQLQGGHQGSEGEAGPAANTEDSSADK